MVDNFAQETLLLAAKISELTLVGNLFNQRGCDCADVAFKQLNSACGPLVEGGSAILADDVACQTLRNWRLSGDVETHSSVEATPSPSILNLLFSAILNNI